MGYCLFTFIIFLDVIHFINYNLINNYSGLNNLLQVVYWNKSNTGEKAMITWSIDGDLKRKTNHFIINVICIK